MELPPGCVSVATGVAGTGADISVSQLTSSLAFLLPFIEQNNLYEQVDRLAFDVVNNLTGSAYTGISVNGSMVSTQPIGVLIAMFNVEISTFRCPSDRVG